MRRRLFRVLFSLLIPLCVLVAAARADHKDERLGFALPTPAKWSPIPLTVEERWIVASYQSEKSFRYNDKATGGYTFEFKPGLRMIAFIEDQVKEETKIVEGRDGDGKKKITIDINNPYKNYKDFMERTYTGGGWFVDKEEELKHGDISVTAYEIRIDKAGGLDAPKRILTWVYKIPDAQLAVQFECLAQDYAKLQPDFLRCLKGFKLTKRSGEALIRDVTTGKKLSYAEMEKATPEERKNWRVAHERDSHAQASTSLVEGWKSKQIGRCLFVYSCDDKYLARFAERAEAIWGWLDKNFAFIGQKEYVRAPIIRIYKNQAEYGQAADSESEGSWNSIEIYTYLDDLGAFSPAMRVFNNDAMQHWFNDRDPNLLRSMPAWLQFGLAEALASSKVKAGKLDFGLDLVAREGLRSSMKEGNPLTVRELMLLQPDTMDFELYSQCAALVAFFVDGAAARNPRTKNVLPDYFKNLRGTLDAVIAENKAKNKKSEADEPDTEEEEDAEFKRRTAELKASRKRILDEALNKTFAGWSEADWKQFEAAYKDSL
jgi:hypothetical protein